MTTDYFQSDLKYLISIGEHPPTVRLILAWLCFWIEITDVEE